MKLTSILIRGLSSEVVERIDAEAAALGLSRNEFLRRKLEGSAQPSHETQVTAADWGRSAEIFSDLADDSIMDDAWR